MLKRYFFTGLITLLPLAVTAMVFSFVVRILTHPFMDMVTQLVGDWPVSEPFIRFISELLILVSIFLVILLVGMLARVFFIDKLLEFSNWLLHKIPLVNKIYKTLQGIVSSLFSSDQRALQQVVMIPFPCPGSYVLGLIAREAPQSSEPNMDTTNVSVFIPTAPNPTTGYLLLCPRSDLIMLEMSSDEALKYIVSCGVAPPTSKEETL